MPPGPSQIGCIGSPAAPPPRATPAGLARRAGREIDPAVVDARMIPVRARAVAQIEDLAVGEQQRRIEAVAVEPDRVGPRPGRVLGRDEEVSAAPGRADQRRYQEEAPGVVAQRRRVDAARARYAAQI